VMGEKLQEQGVMRMGLTQHQEIAELASLTKRWKAKTTCKPAYVVPACSEYRGSVPPPL